MLTHFELPSVINVQSIRLNSECCVSVFGPFLPWVWVLHSNVILKHFYCIQTSFTPWIPSGVWTCIPIWTFLHLAHLSYEPNTLCHASIHTQCRTLDFCVLIRGICAGRPENVTKGTGGGRVTTEMLFRPSCLMASQSSTHGLSSAGSCWGYLRIYILYKHTFTREALSEVSEDISYLVQKYSYKQWCLGQKHITK